MLIDSYLDKVLETFALPEECINVMVKTLHKKPKVYTNGIFSEALKYCSRMSAFVIRTGNQTTGPKNKTE